MFSNASPPFCLQICPRLWDQSVTSHRSCSNRPWARGSTNTCTPRLMVREHVIVWRGQRSGFLWQTEHRQTDMMRMSLKHLCVRVWRCWFSHVAGFTFSADDYRDKEGMYDEIIRLKKVKCHKTSHAYFRKKTPVHTWYNTVCVSVVLSAAAAAVAAAGWEHVSAAGELLQTSVWGVHLWSVEASLRRVLNAYWFRLLFCNQGFVTVQKLKWLLKGHIMNVSLLLLTSLWVLDTYRLVLHGFLLQNLLRCLIRRSRKTLCRHFVKHFVLAAERLQFSIYLYRLGVGVMDVFEFWSDPLQLWHLS